MPTEVSSKWFLEACHVMLGPLGFSRDLQGQKFFFVVVALEQLSKTGCFPEAFIFILGLSINVFVLKHPRVLIL